MNFAGENQGTYYVEGMQMKRENNIDLLKVFCMLMIVFTHSINQGG